MVIFYLHRKVNSRLRFQRLSARPTLAAGALTAARWIVAQRRPYMYRASGMCESVRSVVAVWILTRYLTAVVVDRRLIRTIATSSLNWFDQLQLQSGA